jgi:hypothetical protein
MEDLPEPDTPVKTVMRRFVMRRFGMRSEMLLRLLSRAPRISMYSVTGSSSPRSQADRLLRRRRYRPSASRELIAIHPAIVAPWQ